MRAQQELRVSEQGTIRLGRLDRQNVKGSTSENTFVKRTDQINRVHNRTTSSVDEIAGWWHSSQQITVD